MSSVLVMNTGSSSLKYQLIEPTSEVVLAQGLVERIGTPDSRLVHRSGMQAVDTLEDLPDHRSALRRVLGELLEHGPGLADLVAIGHRIVHGGSEYQHPTLYDAAVDAAIEKLVPLAPLHNPPALAGLRVLAQLLPQVPQVAVFDTAFHVTLPPAAYTYALPRKVAEAHGVRRYGFHGISYAFVARKAPALLGLDADETNLIVCHLGNGASMAAIQGGRCIDTTMGLTPLAGLVMGTRSGDIDPGVVFHLARTAGMSVDQIEACLTRESGLAGLTGQADMREVRASALGGDESAQLGLEVYSRRIRSYIGAYLAHLPRLDALVFTAGVGENDPELRRDVCRPLEHFGIRLDADLNTRTGNKPRRIDDHSAGVPVLVVPTNEEAEIARQTATAVAGVPTR